MAKRKMSTFERLRSGKMNRKERKEWQQRHLRQAIMEKNPIPAYQGGGTGASRT